MMRPSRSRALYLRFAGWLMRPSAVDGRLVVAGGVLACAAFVWGMGAAGKEPLAWKILGAFPATAPARDLRSISDSLPCFENGGNPYVRNDCDIEGRPYNYPRLWLGLTKLGLNRENAALWRTGASVVFFAVICLILGKLNLNSGLVAAAAVCSPVVWFGVEVGNIDFWVFSVLGAAVLLFRRGWAGAGYGLILLAAVLKIFPAASFVSAAREGTPRRVLAAAAALVLPFALYLWAIYPDLVLMLHGIPHMEYISFGRAVLFRTLGMSEHAADVASALALAFCAALAFAAARRIARLGWSVGREETAELTSFRMGAAIFGLAFASPSSFDYRLAFLLLTLPQILAWIKGCNGWGAVSTLAMAGMLCALWGYRGPWTRIGLDEAVNWGLFVYFAAALVLTAPGWSIWRSRTAAP